jgi:hypothetical protein
MTLCSALCRQSRLKLRDPLADLIEGLLHLCRLSPERFGFLRRRIARRSAIR